MIPGAGTGTSDSLFIVVSENPSSSILLTSLILRKIKLNVQCQHDIVKVESISFTTQHTRNPDWTLTVDRLGLKTARRCTPVRLYCLQTKSEV